MRAGEVDAVTFTSSSTVRNLAALLDGDLEALRGAVVACIGPATAEAAREAGLPPDVVAEEASVDGLVVALREDTRGSSSSRRRPASDDRRSPLRGAAASPARVAGCERARRCAGWYARRGSIPPRSSTRCS